MCWSYCRVIGNCTLLSDWMGIFMCCLHLGPPKFPWSDLWHNFLFLSYTLSHTSLILVVPDCRRWQGSGQPSVYSSRQRSARGWRTPSRWFNGLHENTPELRCRTHQPRAVVWRLCYGHQAEVSPQCTILQYSQVHRGHRSQKRVLQRHFPLHIGQEVDFRACHIWYTLEGTLSFEHSSQSHCLVLDVCHLQ